MTSPLLDYTQQNYADWKDKFRRESAVGGLLGHAKQVAGIPDAPQSPVMAPPPAAPPPQTLLGEDPNHLHKKGFRGAVRHLLGMDSISPDTAQLLDPEQKQRLLQMGTFGQLALGGEQGAAQNMIALRAQKKGMDTAAEQEAEWRRIISDTAHITDPVERTRQRALMSAAARLPSEEMRLAAGQLKPAAPIEVSRGAALVAPDGTVSIPAPIDPMPSLEVKPYLGGTARFKDGVFDSWVIRPVSERGASIADAMEAQRLAQRTQGLRDDYANDPIIKTAKNYASAFQGVIAAASESNPQSNLALMYEAVKMRDPNAVREGELALQRGARSVPGWLYAAWDKAAKGNVLTDTERAQIVDWAREKVNQQERLVTPIQQTFGEQARRFGVQADSAFIAPNPFAGTSRTASPSSDLPKTARVKPANATDAEWAAFLLTKGERP